MKLKYLTGILIICLFTSGCGARNQSESVNDGKTELELAVTFPTPFLEQAVVDFNSRNERYEIYIRIPDQDESIDDYKNKISAEISRGKGPDIVSNYVINTFDGAENGFLLDLSWLGDMNLVPNVDNIGLVDGKRYAVPYDFNVTTVVVPESLVLGKTSWTIKDMMDVTKKMGASKALASAKSSYLYYLMGFSNQTNVSLIDRDTGRCNLLGKESLDLLEFCKEYGNLHHQQEDYLKILSGEIMGDIYTINNLASVQSFTHFYKNEEYYIGLPVEDGKSGSFMRANMLSVNQNCEHIDGVEEFILFLLSDLKQNELAEKIYEVGYASFPVNNSSFNKVFDIARGLLIDTPEEYIYEAVIGEYEFLIEPLGEKSLEKVYNLLTQARVLDYKEDALIDIIMEECEDYFDGIKSADEVCSNMQNRVQLYLDE